jgi:hypothetical protein
MPVKPICKGRYHMRPLTELNYTVTNTKTIAAAEAKYNIANIEYLQGKYKHRKKPASIWLKIYLTTIIG